jgi:rhodanese-related sulfurtransferase
MHQIPPRAIPEIDIDQLAERLREGSVVVLDVREIWEYNRRRVPGSMSVPLDQLPGRIAELPRDRPLAVICEHGNRSLAATGFLLGRGFESAVSVRGGTDAWARSNRPVEAG